MADQTTKAAHTEEPRGFAEHTRGLPGEYAHEQGWNLNVEERTAQPQEAQDTDGGTDYDYGARDFGDSPVNTAIDHPNTTQDQPAAGKAGKE